MVTSSLTSAIKTSNRVYSLAQIIYFTIERIIHIIIYPLLWLFSIDKNFKNVENQIILITGGGNGIGQLMALKFLKLGAKVVVWDIDQDGLNKTKSMAQEQMSTEKASKLYCYIIDLSKAESIYESARLVKKEIGPVDILINNAGVVNGKNILDLPDKKIEWLFRVNSLSHFFTIKAFLPDMIKRKRGHIVTIASICGELGVAQLSDYCASKFALMGMEQSLRFELAKANLSDQIKTTIVKPWMINTGLFAGANPGFFPYLDPDQVAQQIVEAILQEKISVTLPWYMAYLIPIIVWIMPSRCLIPIYDFSGGFESMDHFEGRSNCADTAEDQ